MISIGEAKIDFESDLIPITNNYFTSSSAPYLLRFCITNRIPFIKRIITFIKTGKYSKIVEYRFDGNVTYIGTNKLEIKPITDFEKTYN